MLTYRTAVVVVYSTSSSTSTGKVGAGYAGYGARIIVIHSTVLCVYGVVGITP